jgi:hypothetical protein
VEIRVDPPQGVRNISMAKVHAMSPDELQGFMARQHRFFGCHPRRRARAGEVMNAGMSGKSLADVSHPWYASARNRTGNRVEGKRNADRLE